MAIELRKRGDSHRIDLTKRDNVTGEILINLNWSNSGNGVDLDLGCYYELLGGYCNCIDGIQFSHGRGGARDIYSRQGCYTKPPYIWHNGDDRTGNTSDGEVISVNPDGVRAISRIMVYAYIYDGVPNWRMSDAVVTVRVPGCEPVCVKMDEHNSDKRFCAIAELVFNNDNTVTVRKLVTFHNGHSSCGRMYGWKLDFKPAKKD